MRILSPCIIVMLALYLSPSARAQISGTPQQVAAQRALEKGYPRMPITDRFLGLRIPQSTLGQTVGVAVLCEASCSSTRAPIRRASRAAGRPHACSSGDRARSTGS